MRIFGLGDISRFTATSDIWWRTKRWTSDRKLRRVPSQKHIITPLDQKGKLSSIANCIIVHPYLTPWLATVQRNFWFINLFALHEGDHISGHNLFSRELRVMLFGGDDILCLWSVGVQRVQFIQFLNSFLTGERPLEVWGCRPRQRWIFYIKFNRMSKVRKDHLRERSNDWRVWTKCGRWLGCSRLSGPVLKSSIQEERFSSMYLCCPW